MADRGDVVQLRRRVGFGVGKEAERFVVIQATSLNAILPTMIVVPLDPQASLFSSSPLAVKVSAREAGATSEHAAIASWVSVMNGDRFAPGGWDD